MKESHSLRGRKSVKFNSLKNSFTVKVIHFNIDFRSNCLAVFSKTPVLGKR